MDIGLLFKDIFTFNIKSLVLRKNRLSAVMKRKRRGEKIATVDYKNIPVIINNRNRLAYLLPLINWLEKAGMKNIIILDNDSTFPPLLEFYKTTKHRVIKLGENVGHLALWKSDFYKEVENRFYIYTDPDVVPVDECPLDAVKFLLRQLEIYSSIEKIGLGLKIDDLPDHYKDKQKVIDWESKYWKKKIAEHVFDAEVDTTFALYRPFTNGAKWVAPAYRTGPPYIARHLPWYEDSKNQTEENIFYMENVKKGSSHWMNKN